MRPRPEPLGWLGLLCLVLLFVGLVVGLVVLKGLAAQVMQGDWHCAYRRCILVQSK